MIGPQAPPEDHLDGDGMSNPMSPYSANQAAIRNLTLPTIADLDIPASPPGSPPAGMDHKFEHFLQLKKHGVHFNQKLAASSALKNPMLLPKLMSSAGLTEKDQYATTLPKDLWDSSAFPAWAYKEELAKSQQLITKRTKRDSIDFVPGSSEAISDAGPIPSSTSSSKGTRASAAERIAAGLEQDKMRPARGRDQSVRRDLEKRNGP
ncbi:MAG: hypothetical protein L6R40_002993 [Gallowayella cf. fulva]|nr:MAG: hypothetical protein L6R40_002993 [Xanthomendoza cf. fulva]